MLISPAREGLSSVELGVTTVHRLLRCISASDIISAPENISETEMDAANRAAALYKIRTTFGWSAADVAQKLDVSPRLVGMWETGTQPIPDGRWRLFLHEVSDELPRRREFVVVNAADGSTPLDVISDANFYDLNQDLESGIGVVSSYAIDRVTGRPYLHMQRFPLATNQHVIRAAKHWRAALGAGVSTGESEMLAMHRRLTRRVLEAEQSNPRLRELKEKIAAASRAADLAMDATEDVRREKLHELDRAVFALIHEVDGSKGV